MRSLNLHYVALVLIAGLAFGTVNAEVKMKKPSSIKIAHTETDFPVSSLDENAWKKADDTTINTYWSGEKAPAGRHFKARLLWSDTALYFRFEANQTEPLIVSEKANLASKTLKLWGRDVCEIFIAPNRNAAKKYFEFEIAPNGEWVDLAIDLTSGKRETDWEYNSGMTSAAKIEKGRVIMAVRIEWKALGKAPKVGDIWLGNLFRCVGKGPTRGYLSWQPTRTKEPSFHVPEAFGEFVFVD